MRYLTFAEVLFLHDRLLATSGGADGVRDLRAIEAAIAQPKLTFDGEDLYPTVIEKAAALCFSLVQGHPFIDGNKRIGHASTSRSASCSRWPRGCCRVSSSSPG